MGSIDRTISGTVKLEGGAALGALSASDGVALWRETPLLEFWHCAAISQTVDAGDSS